MQQIQMIHKLLLCLAISWRTCQALDNGLALTPPMGCTSSPKIPESSDEKIKLIHTEKDFKELVDVVVNEGYKDLGYQYIIFRNPSQIERHPVEGKLLVRQFPEGMKTLSDYVHSKGLKFGLHIDLANLYDRTQKYPEEHMESDAQTLTDWGVDFVQLDDTNFVTWNTPFRDYAPFGTYLNKTAKPIVYSCGWVSRAEFAFPQLSYKNVAKACNIWTSGYLSLGLFLGESGLHNRFAVFRNHTQPFTGPGSWDYPDPLYIGNPQLTYEQSKMIMAIWAILATPLITHTDLREIEPRFKAILQNKRIIQVNQDPLGIGGRRTLKNETMEVYTRPIAPVINGYKSFAIAVLNRDTGSDPQSYTVSLGELGLSSTNGYRFEDLYSSTASHTETDSFVLRPDQELNVKINSSDVIFFKATVLATDNKAN